jgi:Pentapeptide repeats (8 copies)
MANFSAVMPTHCSAGQPLAGRIRDELAADDELRQLRERLQAHLFRGVAWWDDQRRRHAASRLRRLAPALPPTIRPAALAGVVAQYSGEPYYPRAHDVQAAMMSHRLRHRLAVVLAGANLEGANLKDANLRKANLRGRRPGGRQPGERQPGERQP